MGPSRPHLVNIMKIRASGLTKYFNFARLAVVAACLLSACQVSAVEARLVEPVAATPVSPSEHVESQPVPAPPVDLDQPLPEAQPLSVTADGSKQAAMVDRAPELAEPAQVITQAKSVDLGEPLPAALPLQVVDDKPVEHEQAQSANRSETVAGPKPGAAAAQQAEITRVSADKTAEVIKPVRPKYGC